MLEALVSNLRCPHCKVLVEDVATEATGDIVLTCGCVVSAEIRLCILLEHVGRPFLDRHEYPRLSHEEN